MKRMLTSIAAMLIVAAPAMGQPGQGNGAGNGKPDKAQGGGKPAAAPGSSRPDKPEQARSGGNNANRQTAAPDQSRGNAAPDRGNGRSSAPGAGAGEPGSRGAAARAAANGGAASVVRDLFGAPSRGRLTGCPPGLAAKHNGCLPPGQEKKAFAWYDSAGPGWWGYGGYGDGRYFYRDGYLLRLGLDGGIASFIPLLGGALGIGRGWPDYYEPVAMPRYYESYYDLGPPRSYRYADRVIYRVDPETAAITAIAALLTGDDFAIGEPEPRGYDVYNVPYGYRDRYRDGPDARYRYADGYIYRIDPETRLVAAAIELLVQ